MKYFIGLIYTKQQYSYGGNLPVGESEDNMINKEKLTNERNCAKVYEICQTKSGWTCGIILCKLEEHKITQGPHCFTSQHNAI